MKKKLSVRKIIIFIVILIIVISSVFIGIKVFNKEEKPNRVVDEINGYILEDNKSSYYKNLFEELKNVLKSNSSEEEYAKIISKLFIADFLSLHYADNKNDVGGLQYVYESYRDDFTLLAKDSIYDIVENNIYKNRNQVLPIVKEVKIMEIDQDDFIYQNKTIENAYYVTVEISYDKELDYPKEVDLVLIKNNDKMEVVEMDSK